MPAPTSLKRLVSIRQVEEQHSRTRMEMAIAELHHLETALEGARKRARCGRMRIASAVSSGECEDRIAGMAEVAAADRVTTLLAQRILCAEQQLGELREAFLAKRVERRQAQSLLDAQAVEEAIEASRRSQMALDEWHRSRNSSRRAAPRLKEGSNKTVALNASSDSQES